MFRLVEKRKWYFLISAILIIPGLIAMIVSTVNTGAPWQLGIDFVGGSVLEVGFANDVDIELARDIVSELGYSDPTINTIGSDNTISIRTKSMSVEEKNVIVAALSEKFGEAEERQFNSVGPAVGQETARAAGMALLATSVAILAFVAIAFHKVPHAGRYGACAIFKMLHDVLFLLGFASIMGFVAGWEIDTMFLTAVLTVLGFSVQDVIVVFDRIRENITRRRTEPYETIVNRSLLETLHRSLATQLNAIFVMLAIALFGGDTTRQFMITMLVGMGIGTYSSLFFATPLLVVWNNREWPWLRKSKAATTA